VAQALVLVKLALVKLALGRQVRVKLALGKLMVSRTHLLST
jgi:hypothetical protein